ARGGGCRVPGRSARCFGVARLARPRQGAVQGGAGAALGFRSGAASLSPRISHYLQEQKAQGRRLVLATATDRRIALKIADHLSLFDEVIASDGANNLGGAAKAAALVERFGARGFVYAGNARADLAVWREAAAAIVVAAPKRVRAAAEVEAPVERVVPRQGSILRGVIRALRPHQWVKNLLVFVPLVCAAAFDSIGGWEAALECFFGFCAI